MAYPDFAQTKRSVRISLAPPAETYVASDGSIYTRDYRNGAVKPYEFRVEHELLSEANMDTLLADYFASLGSTTTFTWKGDYDDGTTYTVHYVAEPEFVAGRGQLYEARVILRGTQNP